MTTAPMSKTMQRVIRARALLLLDDPFFGVPALRLQIVEDPRANPPTAWTDGTRIGFHPDFVAALSDKQLATLWAHEVMHCMMGHPWRRDGREPRRYNIAADRAINPLLREAKYSMPPDALYELAPDHYGKSVEWIYARSPDDAKPPKPPEPPEDEDDEEQDGGEEQEQQGGGGDGDEGDEEQDGGGGGGDDGDDETDGPAGDEAQGGGGGHQPDAEEPKSKGPESWGGVRDAPDTVPAPDGTEQPANTEEDWRQLMQQAAAMAKGQGKLPGAMERAVQQATRSRLDWKAALRRFAQERVRDDYSWKRPNRRYLASGVYLPSLHSEAFGSIVVGVDTSGSIDQELLAQFSAELSAIVDEVQPKRVTVMYCDDALQRTEVFERGDTVTVKAKGGGGTDFRPVFEALDDLDEPPVCVVYLTDMYGTFPEHDPGVPTLWVTWTERPPQAPFGEVVYADT